MYVMECYVENNDKDTYNHEQSYAENAIKNTLPVSEFEKSKKTEYTQRYLSAFYKQEVKIIIN